MCSFNAAHENKKPRRDLGKDSIDFLFKVMRSEIGMVPSCEKQAFMEAYSKGRNEEFSDERRLKFLRCEGMNAKHVSCLLSMPWYTPILNSRSVVSLSSLPIAL
mmetsp:Transcript_32038/g.57949  ORF Transcript_32038/g.57949 Transcript_32038/m.57949 type:complete len:104 (+) Transcript_32038:368-679(+)